MTVSHDAYGVILGRLSLDERELVEEIGAWEDHAARVMRQYKPFYEWLYKDACPLLPDDGSMVA